MRLLVVTNDFPPKPGGIQQYLGRLVSAFAGPVLVLAPASPGPEAIAAPHVSVHRHRRRFLWPTAEVRRWIGREGEAFAPDAVVFGAPYPLAWLAARVGRDLAVPTAVICHGAEVTIPAALPVARQLLRASLRRAGTRMAVSRYTSRRVERLTRRTVGYLGSGVDAAEFTPASVPRDPEHPPVVGCVSRFVPRKGQQRLIRAAAVLARKGVALQLLFVGTGRKLAALRRLAARLEVAVRFEVAVPWSSLPGLYREMDVFAMPCRSRWGGLEVEGLGIVYLEAAACGLPVLAGDSGGAPETVLAGTSGFVVRSVGDIAEGLELLLRDPARAREMGLAGRSFVTSHYTWEAVCGRLEAALAGSD